MRYEHHDDDDDDDVGVDDYDADDDADDGDGGDDDSIKPASSMKRKIVQRAPSRSGHFLTQPRREAGVENHPRQPIRPDERDIGIFDFSDIARMPDEEHPVIGP